MCDCWFNKDKCVTVDLTKKNAWCMLAAKPMVAMSSSEWWVFLVEKKQQQRHRMVLPICTRISERRGCWDSQKKSEAAVETQRGRLVGSWMWRVLAWEWLEQGGKSLCVLFFLFDAGAFLWGAGKRQSNQHKLSRTKDAKIKRPLWIRCTNRPSAAPCKFRLCWES
jgi:hypothetical protein